jgi:hypothetical protein
MFRLSHAYASAIFVPLKYHKALNFAKYTRFTSFNIISNSILDLVSLTIRDTVAVVNTCSVDNRFWKNIYLSLAL